MKKSYLKPESDAWFYLQCMIFYNGYDGNGRKKPRKTYIHENKEQIPNLVSLPSPRLENWRPTVFRVERNRKQAGPTLGRAGILIYRDKCDILFLFIAFCYALCSKEILTKRIAGLHGIFLN